MPETRPRRRLLVADDSVTIQRVIELTFADEDIDVAAVGDGDAALARLASDPPDIVLADVGMPGRDGYDIALHVHATPALSHIPVVLLIGALQPLDEGRAKASACAGVLIKPFEPQLVIEKVRDLLKRAERSREEPAGERLAAAPDGPSPTAPSAEPPAGAPAPPPVPAAESPDEYFARLDAAFASLEGYAEPPATPEPGAQLVASTVPPPPEEPRSGADLPASSPAGRAPAPGVTMADAFAALLAIEQGETPSRLPDDWPSPLTDVVEEIAQRVAEQVTERVVRALAPEIVARVSERLVKEEIDRLRQELASS